METWQNRSLIDLDGEIWLPVVGYEDTHMVSNLGRVKSHPKYQISGVDHKPRLRKGKILKLAMNRLGYIKATIQSDKVTKYGVAHRLVCQAFLPNPENKPQVNHKNGIKHDNRVENLEWATGTENQKHAYKTGLKKCKMGSEHHNGVISDEDAITIIKEYKKYSGERNKTAIRESLSQKYGITPQHVRMIALGFKRSHLQSLA